MPVYPNNLSSINAGEHQNSLAYSVRTWRHEHPLDEWKPSKKGLAMSVDKLPELINALEKAQEAIETERPAPKGGADDPDA